MTPTALTPAGRGTSSRSRPAAVKRAPARTGGATAVAEGARTAAHGARTAAQGARTAAAGTRTAAQGARTAAQGARTAAAGTRTAVRGARTAAQGTRAMAQGARIAAEGARTVAQGARRTPIASAPAGARGAGHRFPLGRSTAPRAPRRVSGPARPRFGPARPGFGPARPGFGPARPAGEQPVLRAPLAARWAGHIRALPDHALLDRIIRGRYWIPLLGVLLVGIVAMQVEVLKLNAGIGRGLGESTSLQIRNEQLRAAVAREADDQRIESMAAHMGMVMPQPAAIRFLSRHPIADLGKALGSIHGPDATGFEAALAASSPATAAAAGSAASATGATTGAASATGATTGAASTTGATTGAASTTGPTTAGAASATGPTTGGDGTPAVTPPNTDTSSTSPGA